MSGGFLSLQLLKKMTLEAMSAIERNGRVYFNFMMMN